MVASPFFGKVRMMMQRKGARTLLPVVGLLTILIAGGMLYTEAQAQGGVRLRLPFDGTFRLTAYVDHESPNYTYNGNVYVYNGEERTNCAACGASDSDPYCYDGHNGTDYALYREPVLAAASGRVTFRAQRSASYGNSIRIDHGSGYETWYSHLETFSVPLNSEVTAGQPIGLSGNSGQNQPYHLHFETLHDGSVTDPFGWRGSSADPIPNGPAFCLWGDGQCTAIITEDESAWYFKYPDDAGWNWDCAGNSWTLRYILNVHTGDSTFARWRPNIPYAGPHSVFVFIPAARNKTTAAKYWIYDRDGLHFVTIDQSNYSEEWVSLGGFDFWDGTPGYVRLYNSTGESDGSTEVCYDSVKFQQFRIDLPLVLKNY